MIIAYWIVAGLAAFVFLAAGATKTLTAKDALAEKGMAYVEDFTALQVKLIGIAEVLGAVGLIVPMLTGILPVLSPIAGIALAVIMIGGTVVHARRKEPFVPTVVLTALAASAAALGFAAL